MTIRQRLLANLGVTLALSLISYGGMFWVAARYDHLQKRIHTVNRQVKGWSDLNFQVSQYLKKAFEVLLSPRRELNGELDVLTDEIIHTLIDLEKTALVQTTYLAPQELQEYRSQLVAARDQFGQINAEIEEATSILAEGLQAKALALMDSRITKPGLDQGFVQLIKTTLKNEERHADQIETAFQRLRNQLIALAGGLIVLNLVLSGFLMSWINHSIQQSIGVAKKALLHGTKSIGAGDLETQIEIRTQDELSIVAEAFNKMIEDLKIAWHLIGQQRQQMVASSKMSSLGEMAGGVAHEINNPLAAIKSLSGQMQEVIDDDPLDKALLKEMASKVELTTDRIAKIVQGLLSFSRDGSKDPHQTINVRQLIEEALSFCSERFKNDGTQIKIEDFQEGLLLEGRSTELSQVLLNLVGNAYDAISELPVKWIQLSVLDQQEWIEIRVTDSGAGIPPEIAEKLFQPFFTTKEIGKGTGLGLGISLGIVHNHMGTLKVDTQCKNTCFVIRLPKRQKPALTRTAA